MRELHHGQVKALLEARGCREDHAAFAVDDDSVRTFHTFYPSQERLAPRAPPSAYGLDGIVAHGVFQTEAALDNEPCASTARERGAC
jgi:hypothetical protein